ncbi:MAG TPA: acyl-CoA dehydrogenase family protein, partial [Rugosimonospora sp.]|nr:acyl-CoA dehydrogenase family protein [Rugosimonospora sp.]
MDVGLTADQQALRGAVRELLGEQCPPAAVRAAWTDPSGVDGLWLRLAEMGVFGVAVPESAGGLGLDEMALVPLLDEVGYAAVPAPVAETAAVVAPLLAALGDPPGLLPDLLAGRAKVALATGDLVPYGARSDAVLTLDGEQAWLGKPEPAAVSTVDGSRAPATAD